MSKGVQFVKYIDSLYQIDLSYYIHPKPILVHRSSRMDDIPMFSSNE